MDGSRIRNKTVSFSFENGVVWTGSYGSFSCALCMQLCMQSRIMKIFKLSRPGIKTRTVAAAELLQELKTKGKCLLNQ